MEIFALGRRRGVSAVDAVSLCCSSASAVAMGDFARAGCILLRHCGMSDMLEMDRKDMLTGLYLQTFEIIVKHVDRF